MEASLVSGAVWFAGLHGPFRLNVHSRPRDLVKTLLEVGVEDLPYSRPSQCVEMAVMGFEPMPPERLDPLDPDKV